MKLLLAVDIADRVKNAAAHGGVFDIQSEAQQLMARHPEAHVSVDDIMATMQNEMREPLEASLP